MVKNTKTWISWEQNIIFYQIKKFLICALDDSFFITSNVLLWILRERFVTKNNERSLFCRVMPIALWCIISVCKVKVAFSFIIHFFHLGSTRRPFGETCRKRLPKFLSFLSSLICSTSTNKNQWIISVVVSNQLKVENLKSRQILWK